VLDNVDRSLTWTLSQRLSKDWSWFGHTYVPPNIQTLASIQRKLLFFRCWTVANQPSMADCPYQFGYLQRLTVNHSILLRHLQTAFGVVCTALDWLQLFWSDRDRYVKLIRHCLETLSSSEDFPKNQSLGHFSLLFTFHELDTWSTARESITISVLTTLTAPTSSFHWTLHHCR